MPDLRRDLLPRVLLLTSCPTALWWVDLCAVAFRDDVDVRAEQCSVAWLVLVGAWSAWRVFPPCLALVAWTSWVSVGLVVGVDALLRAHGSALPPPLGFFGMLYLVLLFNLGLRVQRNAAVRRFCKYVVERQGVA